jgi:hypothetical protein
MTIITVRRLQFYDDADKNDYKISQCKKFTP